MCGINGFTYRDENLIRQMNKAIKHRGPDDDGIYTDESVSLGHVRLSILDLTDAGHQPMVSNDEKFLIVYNGEIYNFKDIRNELATKGYPFKSDSDTEVILYAFKEYGAKIFERLNGIFAFCLYDKKQNALYLVRDRLGIKPLYYYLDNEKLFFSSELIAFHQIPNLKNEINQDSIKEYLHSDNIQSESFNSKIKMVAPGSFVKIDLKNFKLSSEIYINLTNLVSKTQFENNKAKKSNQLVDQLDQLLNDVVKDQMISDAPLGTICSGGVDSSLITAIASRYKKDLKIFNVRVDHEIYDESKYAHQVADFLKLDLIEEVLSKEKYLATYQKCIEFEGLPLTHPNSVGIFLVSQKAKQSGISVLLSGEGADELFGGYHRYKAFYKRLLISNIPILNHLFVKNHRLFTNLELVGATHIDQNIIDQNSAEFPWLKDRLKLTKSFYNAYLFISKNREQHLKAFIAKDLHDYLKAILRRTDRMSMAIGLEMRVPYLDNRLIEFALNLPVKHQTSSRHVKILLKKVAERYLPKEIVRRAKKGFPLPINEWLSTTNYRQTMLENWKKINKV